MLADWKLIIPRYLRYLYGWQAQAAIAYVVLDINTSSLTLSHPAESPNLIIGYTSYLSSRRDIFIYLFYFPLIIASIINKISGLRLSNLRIAWHFRHGHPGPLCHNICMSYLCHGIICGLNWPFIIEICDSRASVSSKSLILQILLVTFDVVGHGST